jgi:hypothetical protein
LLVGPSARVAEGGGRGQQVLEAGVDVAERLLARLLDLLAQLEALLGALLDCHQLGHDAVGVEARRKPADALDGY